MPSTDRFMTGYQLKWTQILLLLLSFNTFVLIDREYIITDLYVVVGQLMVVYKPTNAAAIECTYYMLASIIRLIIEVK